jgi:hypothetical protein
MLVVGPESSFRDLTSWEMGTCPVNGIGWL